MTALPLVEIEVNDETSYSFTNKDIIDAEVVQEINPSSIQLPISEFTMRFINPYSGFTMFSGESYELISQRLPVIVKLDTGVVEYMGKFYLQKWVNKENNVVEITALDILGVLDYTDYDGYFWAESTLLNDVLDAILTPIDVSYNLDASLLAVEVAGWIPPCTCREAVQQVMIASGAIAISAGSDVLEIVPAILPTDSYDMELSDTNKSMQEDIELNPLVTKIELVSHEYSVDDELTTIFNETLDAGTYKIIFEEPYYEVIITGPGYAVLTLALESGDDFVLEDGSTLLEIGGEYIMGSNSLYLDVQSEGEVTVTGYKWLDSKRSFIFNETVEIEWQNKNTKTIRDATMVNLDNAQTVLDFIRDYYRLRYRQGIKIYDTTVLPNTLTLASTLNDKQILGIVTKRVVNMSKGYISNLDILGLEYME